MKMTLGAHKANCMADGGPVYMKHGGPVKGKGTGTSDSVPAMLSKGEYVMPADSTRHIGVKALDAMRKATHKPVKPALGAHKGAVRKMADGGLVDDERRNALIAQIPTDTVQAPLPGQPIPERENSTELGRNISNTINALPVASPLITGAAAMRGGAQLLQAASVPAAAGRVASLAGPALGVGVPAVGTGALIAAASPATPQVPGAVNAGSAQTDAQRAGATGVPALAQPVLQPSTQPAAAPAAPYSGGSIAKTILSDPSNPGLVGKTQRWGDPATGARPMSDLGAGSALVTTPDGTTVKASDYYKAQATAAADPMNRILQMAGTPGTPDYTGRISRLAEAFQKTGSLENQAGRLALDTATHSQDSALKTSQIAGATQIQAAKDAYIKAANSGDEQAKARAEETYRVLTGHAERTTPDRYVPIETSNDPIAGKTVGVLNQRAGTVTDAYGQPLAQGTGKGISKQQYEALPKGAKYIGSDGKPYIKG